MKDLQIKQTEDGGLQVTASKPLSFDDTVDLTLSAILAMMHTIVNDTPKEHQEEVKEYLFTSFNLAASALLAQFAPDIDLRPDITEEAILKAELELAPKYAD